MAPKRRSPFVKNQESKKARKEVEEPQKDETTIKIEELVSALQQEKYPVGGPESNRKMLCSVIETCFPVFKEDRHEWQNRMTACVGEALQHIKEKLDNDVVEIQKFVDNAAQIATDLAAEENLRDDELKARIEELEFAQAKLKEEQEDLKTKEAELTSAKEKEQEIHEQLAEANEQKDEFYTAKDEHFAALKEGCEGAKKIVKTFLPILKKIELDDSLLVAAPTALEKAKESRGMFDNICIDTIEGLLIAKCTSMDEEVAKIQQDVDSQASVVQTQSALVEAATDARNNAKEQVATCLQAKKDAAATLKNAEKDVSNHDKEVKKSADTLQEAEGEVVEFKEVLDKFEFLDARAAPIPEPEQPTEAPEEVQEQTEEAEEAPVEQQEMEVDEQPIMEIVQEIPCA